MIVSVQSDHLEDWRLDLDWDWPYREVPIGEAQREMIDDCVVILLPTPILSAEVRRFSPTAALLILHAQHCRAAVIRALEGLRDYEVHQRVLAELCIYYDLQERLVRRWTSCFST